MNKIRLISLGLFLIGVLFFALSFFYGDASAGIFIIFPFISGSGIYSLLGFLFIFIAVLFFFFGFSGALQKKHNVKAPYEESEPVKKTSVKGGGVILIGPIPIVFGSNWKIALVLMALSIIIIIISFFIVR